MRKADTQATNISRNDLVKKLVDVVNEAYVYFKDQELEELQKKYDDLKYEFDAMKNDNESIVKFYFSETLEVKDRKVTAIKVGHYFCGKCAGESATKLLLSYASVHPSQKFCSNCGRRLLWNEKKHFARYADEVLPERARNQLVKYIENLDKS